MKKNILHSIKKINKPRLLIIGCGDVGLRILPLMQKHFRIFAIIRNIDHAPHIRSLGATPIVADLDHPTSLQRLTNLAHTIIHLAPPPTQGTNDTRTKHLCAILPRGSRLIYISTTGVYGNCHGAQFNESQAVNPQSDRAKRRVDAENILRNWATQSNSSLNILRVPGIYADNRLPITRLEQGTPILSIEDDVYTNHIHADDLARLIVLTVFKGKPQRIYHAVDDSQMTMGQYINTIADTVNLPRPPRLSRAALASQVSPMLLSFMSESRRPTNQRIKQELNFKFHYPTINAWGNAWRNKTLGNT